MMQTLSDQEMTERVIALLAKILKIEPKQIHPQTSLTKELEIDSLTIVRLDLLIQSQLGLALSADKLENIDTVEDLVKALKEHGQPVAQQE